MTTEKGKQLARYNYHVDGQEVTLTPELVQKVIAKGNPHITSGEIVYFIEFCKAMKYNPFAGDAYLIKYDSDKPAQIVVSKDLQIKRAFANPGYKGHQAGIIIQRGNDVMEVEGSFMLKTDILLGGWAKVFVNGVNTPITMKVSIEEYHTYKSLWKSKPATMIRKVALVQALREAFPKETDTAAAYEDEIVEVEAKQVESKVVEGPKTFETLPFEPIDEPEDEYVDADYSIDEEAELDAVAAATDEEIKQYIEHQAEVEIIEEHEVEPVW